MTDTAKESRDDSELFLAPVREGDTVAHKYVAGPVLGIGGMGVVVLARDKLLDRSVAIKFLLPRLASSDRAVQRFIREARAATRITSEHVVKLLEIDELPTGMPFFVMEYLEGRDLRAVLTEVGALPFGRAVDYVLQALQAIAEGHLHGIVHRDLKPSNLFVTYRADGTPLIKVLDFGIAKTLEADGMDEFALTGSEDIRLGSPAYMPPEQLKSPSEVDARSDIWALGVTLYELVCGHHPFVSRSYSDLVLAIATQTPELPSKRRAGIGLPERLERVIMRCLEKDRDGRYADAGELAAALAPFGSEDARVSLRRVQGLGAAIPSRPARSSEPPAPSTATCTTTLLAADKHERPRPRHSSVRIIQRTTPRRLAWWAGVLSAAVIAALGLVWHGRQQGRSERAAQASASAAATTHPIPAPPSPNVGASPSMASSAGPLPAETSRVALPSAKPGPRLNPSRAAATASAAASAVSLPSASVETVATAEGRVPEIERLIEHRR